MDMKVLSTSNASRTMEMFVIRYNLWHVLPRLIFWVSESLHHGQADLKLVTDDYNNLELLFGLFLHSQLISHLDNIRMCKKPDFVSNNI